MEGWVKLHRKLTEKAFYRKDSETVHLWIHLLLSANHEPREEYFGNKPIICQPGQFTTGRKQLTVCTGIDRSKIERILKKLEIIEHQIEQRTSSTNRLITILNWNEYQQIEQQSEQQVSNDRATSEQQVSTLQELKNKRTKELKNKNIVENEFFIAFDNFRKLYPGTKRGNETEFENFMKKHKTWEFILPMLIPAIENQKKSRELKKMKKQFVPEWKNLQTWINNKCWEEIDDNVDSQISVTGF